ncbi:uncharacterized protein LOC117175020 [Belonocnema kinseyi]|uniref:uncharacterized protein LOC117175020 n=1 Tax=Belonocnema kinseyi TaxID=2817044 RepID=UPI00143D9230|nr:uncharacterized protein LOC117175020 [Belonocnema kinseyi]
MSREGKIVTFKLFVFKNQRPTEIRKFILKSTDLSFEKMEENLLAIFPDLKESKYTLLWKDQDEDFITLSTAKEFSTFEGHVLQSEAKDEMKLFINFEDELFAASQKFEQGRQIPNFSCNACHKKLTLMCLDCTSRNIPAQEQKILNIANQSPVQLTRANENCEINTPTTTAGSSGNSSSRNAFSEQGVVFNATPISAPKIFPGPPSTYQFGSKSSEKATPVFGPNVNNFK